MTTNPQISDLERKHQELENQIEEEISHPGSDSLHISELKRQKLQLKDQITNLQERTSVH